jgi:hypothetical protein
LGDYDDDGRVDIFAPRGTSSGVQVWRNLTDRPTWLGWTEGNSPNSATEWSDALLVSGKLLTVSPDVPCVSIWAGDGLSWASLMPQPCTDVGLVTLASADFNHDGKWDVVAATESTGLRAWVQGTSSWTPYQTGLPTTGSYKALALGDVNRDGQVDLAAVGPGLGVKVWFGSKTSTWTSTSTGLPSTSEYTDVAWADMGNDGYLELLASSSGPLGVLMWAYYLPMKNWTQLGSSLTMPMVAYNSLDVGDINDDGKLDMAVARTDFYGESLLCGDGQFGVSSITSPYDGLMQYYAHDVALGDVNRDGKLDLAAVGVDPVPAAARLHFWFGDGGRTWDLDSPSGAVSGERVIIGPINSDGQPDLLCVDTSGHIRIWLAGDVAGPELWTPFAPTGWVSITQSPGCTITVRDLLSGLDVSTAEYAWSNNGGATWSSWRAAACTGSDRTTALQQITVSSVPFGLDSPTSNLIHFRICDMIGLCSTSPNSTVRIDTVAPSTTINVNSTPARSDWTNDNTISVVWSTPFDAVSGVAGYYALPW